MKKPIVQKKMDPVTSSTALSVAGSTVLSLLCCLTKLINRRTASSRRVIGLVLPFGKSALASRLGNVRTSDLRTAGIIDLEDLEFNSLSDEAKGMFTTLKQSGGSGFWTRFGPSIVTRCQQVLQLYESNLCIVICSDYNMMKSCGLNSKNIFVCQPIGTDPVMADLKRSDIYSQSYLSAVAETRGQKLTFTSLDDLVTQIMTNFGLSFST